MTDRGSGLAGAVLVVGGVSGSGKTTVGRRLAERLGWEFLEGDDFHPRQNVEKLRRGDPLDDDDRAPWLGRMREEIARLVAAGRRAVLAASVLKREYRDRLKVGGGQVRFAFLTGDPEVIRSRLQEREGHFADPDLLDSQLETLELDDEAARFEVDRSVDAIVDDIVRWLRTTDSPLD